MSFYGNVTNPQSFFKSIQVSRNDAVISVMETGDNLKIIGDGQFIDTVKVNSNTIGISQLTPNGLYLQCKDDPNKYFKLMIDSNGILEIYEVTIKEG